MGRGEARAEERQGPRRRRCGGKPRMCAFPRCVPELAGRAHVCGARHVRRVRLLRVRAGFCACGRCASQPAPEELVRNDSDGFVGVVGDKDRALAPEL